MPFSSFIASLRFGSITLGLNFSDQHSFFFIDTSHSPLLHICASNRITSFQPSAYTTSRPSKSRKLTTIILIHSIDLLHLGSYQAHVYTPFNVHRAPQFCIREFCSQEELWCWGSVCNKIKPRGTSIGVLELHKCVGRDGVLDTGRAGGRKGARHLGLGLGLWVYRWFFFFFFLFFLFLSFFPFLCPFLQYFLLFLFFSFPSFSPIYVSPPFEKNKKNTPHSIEIDRARFIIPRRIMDLFPGRRFQKEARHLTNLTDLIILTKQDRTALLW